jgi:hypothetical protein
VAWREDDLFDIIEFLYQHLSNPVDGTMHSYGECGMHWETFSQVAGRAKFRPRINDLLALYELSIRRVQHPWSFDELSYMGQIGASGFGKSGIISLVTRCFPKVHGTLVLTPRAPLSDQLFIVFTL